MSKSQAGEGNATAAELKEKTDELQMASLNLFDKMHKARADQPSEAPGQTGSSGESTPNENPAGGEGEKKP